MNKPCIAAIALHHKQATHKDGNNTLSIIIRLKNQQEMSSQPDQLPGKITQIILQKTKPHC